MRLTLKDECSTNELFELISSFLEKNYPDFSKIQNANLYITLKDEHGNECPDNKKTFSLSSNHDIEDSEEFPDKACLWTAKAVDRALEAATTKETFVQEMEKCGYQVHIKKSTITFITPYGKKIRNTRLLNLTEHDCSTKAIYKYLNIDFSDESEKRSIKFFGTVGGISKFCADKNIPNRDHRLLYVLALEDDHYYVGQTANFARRMKEHFLESKKASIQTTNHPPIAVLEIIDMKPFTESECTHYETAKTISCMSQYGVSKVRGGDFLSEDMKEINRLLKTHGFEKKNGKYSLINDEAKKYLKTIKELKTFPVLYKNTDITRTSL